MDPFQIVHAGGDQADADPIYGEDAIWSHRWYAHYPDIGVTGPSANQAGGTQIGTTGIWVGDSTINPENGGLSTIAHEYGHDLGLPDLYDTFTGDDNPVEWWSLMAQSRVSAPGDEAIGTRAQDLGAWEDDSWTGSTIEFSRRAGRPLYLVRPSPTPTSPRPWRWCYRTIESTRCCPRPAEGTQEWWSGAGHDYVASMSRSDVALPAGAATLNVQLAYNIEEDYDYAFLEVESPAGTWTVLPTAAIDPDSGTASEVGIDGSTPGGRMRRHRSTCRSTRDRRSASVPGTSPTAR